MFSIVESALAEVFRADRSPLLDGIQTTCLVQTESTLEKIFKFVFSSTPFTGPIVKICINLLEKLFDDKRLKNIEGASTPEIFAEVLHKRRLSDDHKSSESSTWNESPL